MTRHRRRTLLLLTALALAASSLACNALRHSYPTMNEAATFPPPPSGAVDYRIEMSSIAEVLRESYGDELVDYDAEVAELRPAVVLAHADEHLVCIDVQQYVGADASMSMFTSNPLKDAKVALIDSSGRTLTKAKRTRLKARQRNYNYWLRNHEPPFEPDMMNGGSMEVKGRFCFATQEAFIRRDTQFVTFQLTPGNDTSEFTWRFAGAVAPVATSATAGDGD